MKIYNTSGPQRTLIVESVRKDGQEKIRAHGQANCALIKKAINIPAYLEAQFQGKTRVEPNDPLYAKAFKKIIIGEQFSQPYYSIELDAWENEEDFQ